MTTSGQQQQQSPVSLGSVDDSTSLDGSTSTGTGSVGGSGGSTMRINSNDVENENCTSDGYDACPNTLTFDECVERIGFGRFHWHLIFLCGVGYFAEITELVVVSFVAPSIQKQMSLTDVQYGLLGSSSFVGMAVGALFWGYVSDHLGRKLSFDLTVWLTFFGGFLSAFSPNYAVLLLLRFTAAFGIGGMLPVDYTVFLEFLPQHKRGSNIVLVDAIGVLPALTLSATIAYSFSGTDQVNWRGVLLVAAIPVGIMAVLRRHVPESPRYELANGNVEEAQRIVQRVADQNAVVLPEGWKLLGLAETPQRGTSTRRRDGYELSSNGEMNAGPEPTHQHIYTAHDWTAFTANGYDHHSISLLLRGPLRWTSLRLWALYFCVQFGSAGMVFALPKLFDDFFVAETERAIALDLLIGVVGLIPSCLICYFVVEKSRTKSLAAFAFSAGLSVAGLCYAFLFSNSHVGAITASIFLRGAMEGTFAILNTCAVESYPTVLRTTGMGTAQIFDHIAGSIAPVCFTALYGNAATRSWTFALYATAYLAAVIPALTLPDYAGVNIRDDITVS